jgi:DNA-directed RNA polymerase subunit RPC12/RpoP
MTVLACSECGSTDIAEFGTVTYEAEGPILLCGGAWPHPETRGLAVVDDDGYECAGYRCVDCNEEFRRWEDLVAVEESVCSPA